MRTAVIYPLLFLALVTTSGFPATYYFASNGDDSRTELQAQDQATPWQSIDKFNSVSFMVGDNILFRRGDVFRGGMVLKQSGNAAQPITIGAYGTGNAPVIDGSVAVVSGWNTYQGSLRVSDYAGDATLVIEQVFASGVPLQIARFPNQGYLTIDSVVSKSSFISSGLIGSTDWTGASVHIKTERWSLDWRVIQTFSRATGLVVLNQDANYIPQKGWGVFINNSLNALDLPGEWYYDSTSRRLYVWMPDGSVPSGIEASVVPYGLDAQGRSDITVENLKFSKHSRGGIRCSGSNVIISNCSMEYTDGIGIEASLSDSRIENCVVKYPNQTGIEIYGANNTLFGDTIIGVAMMKRLNRKGLGGNCCTGRGLDFNGAGNVISNCMLDSIGYIGIGFGGQNSVIENNIVSHVCMTTDDGGAIYTWNDDFAHPGSAGSIIRENIVANGIGAPEGGGGGAGWVHGIYMDDRTHDVRIDSNTSLGNVLGIFLHNNRNNTAQGNVCYGNGGAQIQIQRDAIVGENVYGNRVFGNIFFSTSDTQSTIKEELYTGNDSILASVYDNLTGVENPFGVECRRDNVLLWKQSYIDAQALRVNGNKIRNGSFDSSSLGWGSWPSQYFNLTVDSAKSADKRCLKIRYFGDPAQGTPIFQANGSYPIMAGKLYCLTFSAVENHPGFLMPICRMGHSSYANVGLSKQVALDTAWQDFEMFFDGTISDTACRVDFQVSKSDSLIWLDKVSLYEINDAGLTRDLRSRCFYNTNTSDQVFGLGSDTWRYIDGTRGMRSSITLHAFLSRVMIKDSIGVVNGIVDKIKMKSPARLLFVRQVGPGIIKVDFYLKTKQDVKIEICNLRGAIVYSSGKILMNAGRHDEILLRGNRIAGGMYIIKVSAAHFVANQTVAVVN
jgi:parallel beta-helix repeat protein